MEVVVWAEKAPAHMEVAVRVVEKGLGILSEVEKVLGILSEVEKVLGILSEDEKVLVHREGVVRVVEEGR